MKNFLRKDVLRKIPAIAVMAGIFALSALPGEDPLLNAFHFNDKIKHVIAYFVLGISFCLWASPKNWFVRPLFWGILVVVLGTCFGILDEYHQSFVPGRSGNDFGDMVADFIGTLAAPFVYFFGIKVVSVTLLREPKE